MKVKVVIFFVKKNVDAHWKKNLIQNHKNWDLKVCLMLGKSLALRHMIIVRNIVIKCLCYKQNLIQNHKIWDLKVYLMLGKRLSFKAQDNCHPEILL